METLPNDTLLEIARNHPLIHQKMCLLFRRYYEYYLINKQSIEDFIKSRWPDRKIVAASNKILFYVGKFSYPKKFKGIVFDKISDIPFHVRNSINREVASNFAHYNPSDYINLTEEWLYNGKRHRDCGPAVTRRSWSYKHSYKCWYRHGVLHRDNDLPAVEYTNGTKEWWVNGKRHRDPIVINSDGSTLGGPALVRTGGYEEWWVDGKRHREGGPAVIYPGRLEVWYRNGKIYRDNGSAIIYPNDFEHILSNSYAIIKINRSVERLVKGKMKRYEIVNKELYVWDPVERYYRPMSSRPGRYNKLITLLSDETTTDTPINNR